MPALRTRDTQSRSTLEVSTDALQPPALAIISPTPRAFTFPISHNLTDSPFSSPSHSPFEPDLRSLALSSTPPPLCTPEHASPSPSSHRRRKSCSSDIGERRPRKGDEDYIKRPENAFILFRRKCCEDRQASEEGSVDGPTKKQRQADLSKTISQQWKGLSTEERQYWENLAKEKKKEHEALYPNYVYRPQRARDKDGRPKPRKSRRRGSDDDADTDSSLSFIVPVLPPHQRHHGRSASAPTPPPYQSIQVPSVYHMTPSCPTSPTLLPMISRRSSHPDHADDRSHVPFDFYPNDAAYAQSYANLQSSEFLQSMFSMAGLQPTRDSLHPLDVSHIDPMLLPPHHILSPSSSISSGPSSPHMDPQTPHSTMLPQDFSQLSMDPSSSSSPSSSPSSSSCPNFDLQMEMQLQQEYAQFSWATTTDSWPTHSELLLASTDFDLSAIPPIELDVSKCVEPMALLGNGIEYDSCPAGAPQGQEYGAVPSSSSLDTADFSEQSIGAFDHMIPSHGHGF
ncbi:Repressor ROX1 [Termitomyces sp. T112]|nr:Repressor ROX1 [Termitomyces sp. T112]KAH0581196.1 hypothetical protein H2248_012315 [Termitomyces sp. 'cryptogamus']KNZ76081.1 Repressor ROX1 [Termitomyces sp. J132]